MDTTRASLIRQIHDPNNSKAWREFYELHEPLVYRYARARCLSRKDTEKIQSQIMTAVVQQIPDFQYDKTKGGFKNWLRRLSHNKVVDFMRKRHEKQADSGDSRSLPDNDPLPDEAWENNWLQGHLRYCVEQLRASVSEKTYQAFYVLIFEEKEVEAVCRKLDMNANQVYKAKSRLLAMIREKMETLGVE